MDWEFKFRNCSKQCSAHILNSTLFYPPPLYCLAHNDHHITVQYRVEVRQLKYRYFLNLKNSSYNVGVAGVGNGICYWNIKSFHTYTSSFNSFLLLTSLNTAETKTKGWARWFIILLYLYIICFIYSREPSDMKKLLCFRDLIVEFIKFLQYFVLRNGNFPQSSEFSVIPDRLSGNHAQFS